MKVLVINSGSSSIKYKLFDMQRRAALAAGILERIGEESSRLVHSSAAAGAGSGEITRTLQAADHRAGFRALMALLTETRTLPAASELYGIGHRVVHGGEMFQRPTLIQPQVIAGIRGLAPLAPLHNPANLQGIEVTLAECPRVPQVAVFDTAFHQTLPDYAYHYALPRAMYETYHVRRYGFHGTSHGYVARQAAQLLGRPLAELNLIVLHLGNGASAAALRGGVSVDTSMGLTPLEGLMMGTRSGDLDPAVVFHLANAGHKSLTELDVLLNRESGLKGVCGVNDMREVLARAHRGDRLAELAVEMYAYRIKKYIGAYLAALGRVDALVYTAGIGEHAPEIRERSCRDLNGLGIELEAAKNEAPGTVAREIQAATSRVKVLVVPTDEELEIAEQTVACIAGG